MLTPGGAVAAAAALEALLCALPEPGGRPAAAAVVTVESEGEGVATGDPLFDDDDDDDDDDLPLVQGGGEEAPGSPTLPEVQIGRSDPAGGACPVCGKGFGDDAALIQHASSCGVGSAPAPAPASVPPRSTRQTLLPGAKPPPVPAGPKRAAAKVAAAGGSAKRRKAALVFVAPPRTSVVVDSGTEGISSSDDEPIRPPPAPQAPAPPSAVDADAQGAASAAVDAWGDDGLEEEIDPELMAGVRASESSFDFKGQLRAYRADAPREPVAQLKPRGRARGAGTGRGRGKRKYGGKGGRGRAKGRGGRRAAAASSDAMQVNYYAGADSVMADTAGPVDMWERHTSSGLGYE